MKVNTVILAGGVGSRFGANKPKQFIEVDGLPIIVDTLHNFQINKSVSGITIVCHKDWIDYCWNLVRQYAIDKVERVVEGGNTGHDSTRNGVFSLTGMEENDIVIIHDAARPIIPQFIINDLIDIAVENGNACSTVNFYEPLVFTDDQISGNKQIDRSSIKRTGAPQAFRYGTIKSLYERAEFENKHDFVYASVLAIYYGERVFFSKGYDCNIKITTQEDLELYKALKSYLELT